MPRIISEKKKAESSDGKQGRKSHKKLKSYIVTQYLLKNTDKDHLASAKDIIDYLADFGILTERRSIPNKNTENPSLGEATVPLKMARAEARHGKALKGLLERYFK